MNIFLVVTEPLLRGETFIAEVTRKNLQQLAACIVLITCSLPEGLPVTFPRLSELGIECWFSSLRGQFGSSQFNSRDYFEAVIFL